MIPEKAIVKYKVAKFDDIFGKIWKMSGEIKHC
jgi:hypothetical protein